MKQFISLKRLEITPFCLNSGTSIASGSRINEMNLKRVIKLIIWRFKSISAAETKVWETAALSWTLNRCVSHPYRTATPNSSLSLSPVACLFRWSRSPSPQSCPPRQPFPESATFLCRSPFSSSPSPFPAFLSPPPPPFLLFGSHLWLQGAQSPGACGCTITTPFPPLINLQARHVESFIFPIIMRSAEGFYVLFWGITVIYCGAMGELHIFKQYRDLANGTN